MNPAERVTAVTDLLLSALVIAGIVWLARQTMPSGARRLWFGGLFAFAAAGVFGFIGPSPTGAATRPGAGHFRSSSSSPWASTSLPARAVASS